MVYVMHPTLYMVYIMHYKVQTIQCIIMSRRLPGSLYYTYMVDIIIHFIHHTQASAQLAAELGFTRILTSGGAASALQVPS